jgi:hypothetical protein
MANATVQRSELFKASGGQHGYRELRGVAAWPTTNATCTLPVPGLTQVDNVQITAVGTPAADEEQSWSDTLVGGLVAMNTQNPVINLTRTGASKTSGLLFAFRVTGR